MAEWWGFWYVRRQTQMVGAAPETPRFWADYLTWKAGRHRWWPVISPQKTGIAILPFMKDVFWNEWNNYRYCNIKIGERQQRQQQRQQQPQQQQQQQQQQQRPTTNDQRPTTNDQRPTTNDQRPTTNDQQPPTTNHQPPTTNNQQPTTNNQQPTTNNQQPPTTNHQPPTTNNQQPTTTTTAAAGVQPRCFFGRTSIPWFSSAVKASWLRCDSGGSV